MTPPNAQTLMLLVLEVRAHCSQQDHGRAMLI